MHKIRFDRWFPEYHNMIYSNKNKEAQSNIDNLGEIIPNGESVINNDNDVANENINIRSSDFTDSEYSYIDDLYKKYQNKDKASKGEIRKQLNEIKVYFLAKVIEVDEKQFTIAIPINNFEDLSNTLYSKSLSARTGIFQMRTDDDLNNKGLREGRPGNRPFILQHAVDTEGPYDCTPEISLKDLILVPRHLTEDLTDAEETAEEIQAGLAEEIAIAADETGPVGAERKSRLRQEEMDDEFGNRTLVTYYISRYEYERTFVDNTIFTNTEPYLTDPRNPSEFSRTWKDQLINLKNLTLDDVWNDKKQKLRLLELEDVAFKNTDDALSKNIIPVFSSLEDAQDLLLTVLEDVMEPSLLVRQNEFINDPKKYPLTNLDYMDDSLTFLNRSNLPKTETEEFIDRITRYRFIYRSQRRKSLIKDPYDNYQNFRFIFNKFFYDDHFPNSETRNRDAESYYLSEEDKVLFENAINTKIVSMGLGDFLNFWNNGDTKNGEALFIPPSLKGQNLIKVVLKVIFKTIIELPYFIADPTVRSMKYYRKYQYMNNKKVNDRFYLYQQKFRDKVNPTIDDEYDYSYSYEIKNSDEESFESEDSNEESFENEDSDEESFDDESFDSETSDTES